MVNPLIVCRGFEWRLAGLMMEMLAERLLLVIP
jgi:hypothetical protein